MDVRIKIHCSAPFTTLRLFRRANAAEASAAVMTLKRTPCLLVITQYVCISQSPQSRKPVRACWFILELGSGGLCFLALDSPPRSRCGGEGSWRVLLGAGPTRWGGPLARPLGDPAHSCRPHRTAFYPECQGPGSPGSLMIFWEPCGEA